MKYTQKGLEVSTDSQEVIDSIDYFHHQILGSGQSAGLILDAAQNHPTNVLIQIYAAVYYLFAQENEATKHAQRYLSIAAKSTSTANEREQLLYEAVVHWQKLDYSQAITLLIKLIELFPKDTLALKFLEWLFYCTGQAFQAELFLRVCKQCAFANQDEPNFLATYSFALELCGHYSEAMEMAEAAIAMNVVTPWAHHTLAHVYLFNKDITGGINRLSSVQNSWNDILPFLKGHNTWHLALLHLVNRDELAVMKLYPDIFGTSPNVVVEQLDAISLLWRLDMAGLPQHKLYYPVVNALGVHPFEYYIGFNNAHYIYALVRAGQQELANESLYVMKNAVDSLPNGSLWAEVIFPLCQGIAAFAQDDYKTACKLMTPVIDKRIQLGGSDAQAELFAQMYLLSLLHTHQKKEAEEFFSRHLSHYKNTSLADWWWTQL